jgi:hypothetical protein
LTSAAQLPPLWLFPDHHPSTSKTKQAKQKTPTRFSTEDDVKKNDGYIDHMAFLAFELEFFAIVYYKLTNSKNNNN